MRCSKSASFTRRSPDQRAFEQSRGLAPQQSASSRSPAKIARESYSANHIRRSVFTQPGSRTAVQLAPSHERCTFLLRAPPVRHLDKSWSIVETQLGADDRERD